MAVSHESSVRGCWMGKNIGGTLGASIEGKTEITFRALEPLNLITPPARGDAEDYRGTDFS